MYAPCISTITQSYFCTLKTVKQRFVKSESVLSYFPDIARKFKMIYTLIL